MRDWREITRARFDSDILGSGQPAVLRGVVAHWPSVRAGRESPRAMADYLRGFDIGTAAHTMVGAPAIRGRFFYNDELTGTNFEVSQQPFAKSLDKFLELITVAEPPALYVGALPTPSALPGFARDNTFHLVPEGVVPRVWVSNRVTVQTHYDLSLNIACVLAGRRRFTLFPPEQLPNLYVGPLEFTLAGQPISMVRLDEPDLERYPRFVEAWKHAQVVELEPGDALFVPYMWWHHVESLSTFNVLLNYWWDDVPPWAGSAFEALIHGLMSVRGLPPERRELWRLIFDHYVFQTGGDPVAHLAPAQRGIQGALTPQLAATMRNYLLNALGARRR